MSRFVADVDLRDDRRQLDPAVTSTRVLVWWGRRVLGEAEVWTGDRTWEDCRAELFATFGELALSADSVLVSAREHSARDITVVICTRDRPDHLAGCLTELARMDPAPAEVLVVDNAPSNTATAEVAAAHGVRRVQENRAGLGYARNTGWQATRTPFVAFTDDDVRPHRLWAGALSEAFATTGVDCVTGLVVAAELMSPAQRAFESQGGMGKGIAPHVFTERDGVGLHGWMVGVGANMAFRRESLERLGGFDVRLDAGRLTRGGDDIDMFIRLLADGGSATYAPDAVVRHVHRRSLPGLVRQYRDNGTGYAAVLRKYELEDPYGPDQARNARRAWHQTRHVRGLLGAVRRRDHLQLLQLSAEAWGSARGARAFDAESLLRSGPGQAQPSA